MQSKVAQAERLASVGMLAAGVAHEVNNPLGAIFSLTALTLEDMPADHPDRENLEEVVEQTLRCRDIVRGLLEFSRQSDLHIEHVDVNVALEDALGLIGKQALFHNIEIIRDLDPQLPAIHAGRAQVQQGTIAVDSEPGRTRFRIQLPVDTLVAASAVDGAVR